MDELGSVFHTIEASSEEMIQFLSNIIGIPAIGPNSSGKGEQEKADLIQRKLTEWGI